jgi:hypothetical protein
MSGHHAHRRIPAAGRTYRCKTNIEKPPPRIVREIAHTDAVKISARCRWWATTIANPRPGHLPAQRLHVCLGQIHDPSGDAQIRVTKTQSLPASDRPTMGASGGASQLQGAPTHPALVTLGAGIRAVDHCSVRYRLDARSRWRRQFQAPLPSYSKVSRIWPRLRIRLSLTSSSRNLCFADSFEP